MVDLGPDNLLVNAQRVRLFLGIGGGKDEFVQLINIKPHIGRPEFREPLTDGEVRYFYGSGDHWFEATMLATTDIYSTLNDKTELDSLGNTPSELYTIEATSKDGSVATIEINAFLRDFNQEAGEEGFFEYRCFFRITTNNITVS